MVKISKNRGDIVILGNRSGKEFAEKVYKELIKIKQKKDMHPESDDYDLNLKIRFVGLKETDFKGGELKVEILESVRESDIYLISQPIDRSSSRSINDNIIENMLTLEALRNANQRLLTDIMPCFPYARQDVREARECCSAKLMADMLSLYVNGFITIDLHARQIANYFPNIKENRVAVSYPFASPALIPYIKANYNPENLVFVSPDAGGFKRAIFYAEKLGAQVAISNKERSKQPNKVNKIYLLGDVNDMNALVIDDMIDTAGTIEKVVDEIKNKGAKEVSIVTSHAILSDPATEILTKLYNKGVLKEVITTDTVKHSDKYLKENSSWLKILSVAPLVAGMIYRINHGDETTKAYPR